MRSMLTLFLLAFMVMSAPVMAQEAASCETAGLRETLALLPPVENHRTARLYRCSIYAHDLVDKGVSMANLPPFLASELMVRLTDGLLVNGELFGVNVTNPDLTGQQFVRLMIKVPPCAMYSDMPPDRLERLDISIYYAELFIDAAMADEMCRIDAVWCDDCQ